MIEAILHSFVNIFAGGRSESKIFLFLIYLIILFSIFFIFKKNKIKNLSLNWKYFGLTIILFYIYGLFIHIFYISYFGLDLNTFFITGNNNEISSSVTSHIHEAKSFVANIISYFGYNNLSTIDAGGSYLNIIPKSLINLGSILLIIVLIQNFLYFISFLKKEINNKNFRQIFFLIFGYAVLSFSIIKTAIDGGVLSIGFLIGVFFVYLFILRSKGFSIFNYYLFAIISSLSIVLCKLYIANVYSSDALILGQITSLILLYVAILYLTEDKIRSRFLFQISILFFASWISTSGRDIDIYTYGKNLINKDEKVYFYDKSKQDVGLLSIEENLSIKAFADKNNKNLSYMPISIPGITCIEKSAYTAIDMNIITFDRINQNQLAKSNFIITKYNDSVIYNKFLWKTNLTMYLNPCSPEPLTIIDSILKKSLIKTYVIVNPVFYD